MHKSTTSVPDGTTFQQKFNIVHLMDCMELMRSKPDGYYDLAVVDPPYRDSNAPTKQMRALETSKMKNWPKKPNSVFFSELFRATKQQIIWGANNFLEHLPSTNCFIFWDKHNPVKNYSDGELAWTSYSSPARRFSYRYFGAHGHDFDGKIHPTQKPVALYDWIFKNYAQPGWKILDTHVGSGSSRIAAHKAGLWFEGTEIDQEYWEAQERRYNDFASQLTLFQP